MHSYSIKNKNRVLYLNSKKKSKINIEKWSFMHAFLFNQK